MIFSSIFLHAVTFSYVLRLDDIRSQIELKLKVISLCMAIMQNNPLPSLYTQYYTLLCDVHVRERWKEIGVWHPVSRVYIIVVAVHSQDHMRFACANAVLAVYCNYFVGNFDMYDIQQSNTNYRALYEHFIFICLLLRNVQQFEHTPRTA